MSYSEDGKKIPFNERRLEDLTGSLTHDRQKPEGLAPTKRPDQNSETEPQSQEVNTQGDENKEE